MQKRNWLALLIAAISGSSLVQAQSPPFITANSLINSSAVVAASGTYALSNIVMTRNRARILENQVSTATRTKYVAVTDSDLTGKTPDEVLSQLTTPAVVSRRDGVRRVEIVIDLQRPTTILTKPGQEANIGTTLVEGLGSQNVEVHSTISAANGLTVIAR